MSYYLNYLNYLIGPINIYFDPGICSLSNLGTWENPQSKYTNPCPLNDMSPSNTKNLQPQKYASRTSGTETVIGNSLKEVLADVLPKQNRKE